MAPYLMVSRALTVVTRLSICGQIEIACRLLSFDPNPGPTPNVLRSELETKSHGLYVHAVGHSREFGVGSYENK